MYQNDFEHAKHILFISIDIIDSTQLKVTAENDPNKKYEWVDMLLDFFSETQVNYADMFKKHIENCPKRKKRQKCPSCSAPEVWKFIGDEVVLKSVIHCKKQLFFNILTLKEVLKKSTEKSPIKGASLKGTAWIAGFPVKNVEVELPKGTTKKADTISDYIGPSIDLGFRLSKFATKSRIILSASLTYLLHRISTEPNLDGLEIYSSGFFEMKGVEDGRQPLFWTPTCIEDKFEMLLMQKVNSETLKTFFNEYYKEKIHPFIIEEDDVPIKYQKEYNDSVKNLRTKKYTTIKKKRSKKGTKKIKKQEIDITEVSNQITNQINPKQRE